MKTDKNDNLAAWLEDPRSKEYFGRSFEIRCDVLALLRTRKGPSMAEIARLYGIKRQSVYQYAREARRIYDL